MALSSSTASGLKKFLTYALGAGQQTLGAGSSQLPYAPLPATLQSKDTAQLGEADLQRVAGVVRTGWWRQAPPPRLGGGRSVLERSPRAGSRTRS